MYLSQGVWREEYICPRGCGERSVSVPGGVAKGVYLYQGVWREECICPRGCGERNVPVSRGSDHIKFSGF